MNFARCHDQSRKSGKDDKRHDARLQERKKVADVALRRNGLISGTCQNLSSVSIGLT